MISTNKEEGSSKELLEIVKRSLEDDKAEDVQIIELFEKTDIADYMVVASGTSKRHVSSIADNLFRKLKSAGVKSSVEGDEKCDWVLIDAADVIVHVFRPEVRDFYEIEKMWHPDFIKRTKA
ncbi:MAG: ribosome silencing factor [Alphaproteobacteria bacterium]|nr:ribosome silencing factor [Alphaproteobacteria bacterium]